MEQLLIRSLDGLVKLERKNGRLGTLVGILLTIVTTLTALGVLMGVTFLSLTKFVNWVEVFFMGAIR